VPNTRPGPRAARLGASGHPGLTFARAAALPTTDQGHLHVLLTGRAPRSRTRTALEKRLRRLRHQPFSARELLARIKAVIAPAAPQLADDVVVDRPGWRTSSPHRPPATCVSAPPRQARSTLLSHPTPSRLAAFLSCPIPRPRVSSSARALLVTPGTPVVGRARWSRRGSLVECAHEVDRERTSARHHAARRPTEGADRARQAGSRRCAAPDTAIVSQAGLHQYHANLAATD
jgi:hypothetical protein